LQQTLASRGVNVSRCETVAQAKAGDLWVLAAGRRSPSASAVLAQARTTFSDAPESAGLIPGRLDHAHVILACGTDARGLVYALLDLADRVENGPEPIAALTIPTSISERPANEVRSVTRLFTSDVEDKPWFNDREMWPQYLSMLAAQRFNRFNLAFGIGYDFIRHVTDAYLLFTYPFFLSVPGYNVRAVGLPDAEVHQRANGRARHGIPNRTVDARLRMDR
jgi:hypothetical protein